MKKARTSIAVLLALLSVQVFWMPERYCFAGETVSTADALSLGELEHGIADRLKRVEEFRFIEQEAARLGVRAWLFGGTAAGYAHYVKWDLQREKGDKRFQPDRFDYDYTNIYRSTQDLDIVIDGTAEQAQALQSALAEKYPHLQGSKTAWEVRLLTQDMGDKLAILNNPDFMNQHTDSNSTGLIEITRPKAGESVVRDVRDWNSKQSHFLKDVHEGALHYYFSPLHGTTKFAKEGRNPPILSAIRYLTKAFQYELKLRPEDLAQVKAVIDEFNPGKDAANSYVSHWIEKNGKKLIQNAVNIEYAWNTLEQLGLRDKLAAIKGDMQRSDSLAWWMNKEPLRTKALGTGNGKTARELGLDIVAHETGNFFAYESMTRAHTGDPNVLISRSRVIGEVAMYGDGFYTKAGNKGAKGSGLTIRFHLDPDAREESDFVQVPGNDFVIVKNKAALKVIPESLHMGPFEYFRMLANSDGKPNKSDRGILEKLKRRIGSKLQTFSPQEERELLDIVWAVIADPSRHDAPILMEWFALPMSNRHPEMLEALIQNGAEVMDRSIARLILSQPHWKGHPELLDALIKKGTELTDKAIAEYVFSKPYWKDHPELLDALIKKGLADPMIIWLVLPHPHWVDHPEFVDALIRNGRFEDWIVEFVLSQPHWKVHPELVETLLLKGNVDRALAEYAFSKPHWKEHPELRRLADGADPTVENLRAAFQRGESVRVNVSSAGACVAQQLERHLGK